MPNVIMMSVVILNVVAPFWHNELVNLKCFKSLLLNTVTQKHFLYSTSLQTCHFYSLHCQLE
jgi:hypothetical protein